MYRIVRLEKTDDGKTLIRGVTPRISEWAAPFVLQMVKKNFPWNAHKFRIYRHDW